MEILACLLRIVTSLKLEEVGEIISNRVLGGIPFGGRNEYIRDEIPAIYSKSLVFGTRFILTGEPDEEGYYLEADAAHSTIANMSAEQIETALVNISSLIAHLLKEVDTFTVSIEPLRNK